MKNIGKIVDNKDIANKKYVDDNSAVEWRKGVDGVVKTNTNATKTKIPARLDFPDIYYTKFMSTFEGKIYLEEGTEGDFALYRERTDSMLGNTYISKLNFTDGGAYIYSSNPYGVMNSMLQIAPLSVFNAFASINLSIDNSVKIGLTKDKIILGSDDTQQIKFNSQKIDLKNIPVINSGFTVFKGLLGGTFTVNVPKSIGAKPALLKFYKCTNTDFPMYVFSIDFENYSSGQPQSMTDIPIESMLQASIRISTVTMASTTWAILSLTETEDTDNYIYNFTVKDQYGNAINPSSHEYGAGWDVDMRFIF